MHRTQHAAFPGVHRIFATSCLCRAEQVYLNGLRDIRLPCMCVIPCVLLIMELNVFNCIVFVECSNNIQDFINMQPDTSYGQVVNCRNFIRMFCLEDS